MLRIIVKTIYRYISLMSVIPKGRKAMVASAIGKLIILLVVLLLGFMIVYLVVPSLRSGAENATSMAFGRE